MRRFASVLMQGASDADVLVSAAFDNIWRVAGGKPVLQHRLDYQLFSEIVAVWRKDCPTTHTGAQNGLSPAKAAIVALPTDERLIIALMVIERMSADQAAGILAITPQRASQIHARARRALDLALGAGRRAEGAA
ncbi:MAG: sigma factor-like helix-turn-helix DNA-binding protein [Caulobacterales bacterium]